MSPVLATSTGAFLWRDGTMYDLQSMIDPGSGWKLFGATDINSHGDILTTASRDGQWSVVILEPITG